MHFIDEMTKNSKRIWSFIIFFIIAVIIISVLSSVPEAKANQIYYRIEKVIGGTTSIIILPLILITLNKISDLLENKKHE